MDELALIDWIRRQGGTERPDILVGPGDDCAVLAAGTQVLLATIDQVLDQVHVDIARAGAEAAGRKAMARNLSDIAAMGGVPFVAVASVALPRDSGEDLGRAIYAGLRNAADAFNCPIVGGDIATWDQRLTVSVTVLGQMREGQSPVLRSGASPGEAICVTGALGNAWQSGRDLAFTPRLAEARELVFRFAPTAMIDLSDGLARDLRHLCAASECGAALDASAIPLAEGADLAGALGDGEDYELLFTVPADSASEIVACGLEGTPVTVIGHTTDAPDLLIKTDDGLAPLPDAGWEHRI
jgi:thiamine-monophosphate kinase